MKDAGYFLVVRFWIDAGAEAQLMRWFNREREPFAQQLRIERFSGEVEFSLEREKQ